MAVKNGKKRSESYVFDLVDALRAPILTHCTAWADTIPERLLKVIQTEWLG